MPTERRVRSAGKNREGDITSLCNAGEWWSPRSKVDAVGDIESNAYAYYVEEQTPRSFVHVYA